MEEQTCRCCGCDKAGLLYFPRQEQDERGDGDEGGLPVDDSLAGEGGDGPAMAPAAAVAPVTKIFPRTSAGPSVSLD
jgi:hypothetical protein